MAEASGANHILAALSRSDFQLLEPHLDVVDLPLRRQLEIRKKTVTDVYFLDSGIASVVVAASATLSVEVGLIGREGMTGLSIVLGNDAPVPNETYMQVAGAGRRLSADNVRKAIAVSRTLHQAMLRFVHAYLAETSRTAVANAVGKIEERLARWLLLAQDRAGDELPLTHEFLALMLGVGRSGVTTALRELEHRGLITNGRRSVTIIDREALEEHTGGTYRAP